MSESKSNTVTKWRHIASPQKEKKIFLHLQTRSCCLSAACGPEFTRISWRRDEGERIMWFKRLRSNACRSSFPQQMAVWLHWKGNSARTLPFMFSIRSMARRFHSYRVLLDFLILLFLDQISALTLDPPVVDHWWNAQIWRKENKIVFITISTVNSPVIWISITECRKPGVTFICVLCLKI